MSKIRILLSLQSADQRSQIEEGFKNLSDIEIIDSYPNGKIALKYSNIFFPDAIIISDFLGDMDAAEFTSLVPKDQNIGIFIISDEKATQISNEALKNGATDVINFTWKKEKEINIESLNKKILPKIRAFTIKKYSAAAQAISSTPTKVASTLTEVKQKQLKSKINKYEIVVIGASTGGPEALKSFIPMLKNDFPLPIVIALHMPAEYTGVMAASLDKKSKLNVIEAKSGDFLKAGNVYLAPGGYHLLIKKKSECNYYFKTNQDSPVHGCRPSVDVLFKSASEIFSTNIIAVMLTGMGIDGTEGMLELYNKGAYCIAQDEESSIVWGMPGSVVEKGITNTVLPLKLIADKLTRLSTTKK